MLRKKHLLFTNRNHPVKGIMSTILGMISWVVVACSVYFSYNNGGEAGLRQGASVLLAFLYGIAGEAAGIVSRLEPDKYYLFSYLGIFLNTMLLGFVGFILYVGAFGL